MVIFKTLVDADEDGEEDDADVLNVGKFKVTIAAAASGYTGD